MNRGRNRQPRPPRGGNQNRGPRGPVQSRSNVPTIQQVVPGAAVSIVLKADQPTGREVQGVVQDLLTRGNHPRGIKVRLQDGRIGRVQRMSSTITAAASTEPAASTALPAVNRPNRILRIERDVRLDEGDYLEGPPPRSLAAYFPDSDGEDERATENSKHQDVASATATCPICGTFEGDEVAVSRHVEEHLT